MQPFYKLQLWKWICEGNIFPSNIYKSAPNWEMACKPTLVLWLQTSPSNLLLTILQAHSSMETYFHLQLLKGKNSLLIH